MHEHRLVAEVRIIKGNHAVCDAGLAARAKEFNQEVKEIVLCMNGKLPQ